MLNIFVPSGGLYKIFIVEHIIQSNVTGNKITS